MVSAFALQTLYNILAVSGEMGSRRAASEAYSFLLEKSLAIIEGFTPECFALFEGVRSIAMQWTVLVGVKLSCEHVCLVHVDGFVGTLVVLLLFCLGCRTAMVREVWVISSFGFLAHKVT